MSFAFSTTTDEVLEGIDLTGTVAVVTGASGGLGLEDKAKVTIQQPKAEDEDETANADEETKPEQAKPSPTKPDANKKDDKGKK